jgi:hypothetical protein
MARSARDAAVAIEALLDETARSKLPAAGYMSFFNTSFEGIKVGFVDPALWRFPLDLWVPSDEAKEQHVGAFTIKPSPQISF